MKNYVPVLAFAGLLGVAVPGAAQDMERVRALYVAAAYEEALAAMPDGLSTVAGTELEQYRALCLLALGREADAKATIERLVKAHPTFVPTADEVSPRMRTLFTTVRNSLIPVIAKQAYADAKAAYDAKDKEAARAGFQRTLELIDTVPEESRGSLADMRLLAADFHELSAPRPAAPAEGARSAPTTAAAPAAPAPAAPAGAFVPAVAVQQELPPWNPLDAVARRTEYVGLLQVQIGPDGRVTLARMLKGSHPAYDMAVLRQAKRWLYKPAMRGGQPVASEREIEIRLRPQPTSEPRAGGSSSGSIHPD
jgi:TonB family protein